MTELVEALTLDDPTAAAIVAINGKGGVGKPALDHLVAEDYPAGQPYAGWSGHTRMPT